MVIIAVDMGDTIHLPNQKSPCEKFASDNNIHEQGSTLTVLNKEISDTEGILYGERASADQESSSDS